MKATGIVRRVDGLGRIIVPKEIRGVFNIKEGDALEIFTDKEGIYFKKYDTYESCIICGAETNKIILDKAICQDCQSKIKCDT